MTAGQLAARIQKRDLPPALLLLGPEAYQRRRVKEALTATFPEDAVARHDLAELSLAEVLDDARSLSLFASERLLWVANAEAPLPRPRAGEDGEGDAAAAGDAAPLAAYLKDPTPGVTVVFEAVRFDFEGEDKRKLDRVRKFYGAVREVIELRRFAPHEARTEAEALVRRAGVRLDSAALDLLVEALGADITRIAVEIEKLSLYAGTRPVGVDDIAALVPDARSTTIFALVNALGRRDRTRALETLDTLVRDGEYLPLALAFLSTQFRMALAAREAGLKSSQQIQGHFTRLGVPMWPSRADQVYQTVAKFSGPQMARALSLIFEADRGLRDARPDDRIVMEQFVLQLTA
ncbi:MAG: DNA polymerase III subunit delta [Acidobacteriia bacterium]|nr:DNA polymerase III subunit delta [Terriglobia bacterium]